MALNTGDNPKQQPKADGAKPAGASGDAAADEYKEDTELLNAAAASGDADVHNLLGERVIAQQNDDREALKDIDERLRAGLNRK